MREEEGDRPVSGRSCNVVRGGISLHPLIIIIVISKSVAKAIILL